MPSYAGAKAGWISEISEYGDFEFQSCAKTRRGKKPKKLSNYDATI
jgi:hypothetical protein